MDIVSMLSIAGCHRSVWNVKLVLPRNSSDWPQGIRSDFGVPIVPRHCFQYLDLYHVIWL